MAKTPHLKDLFKTGKPFTMEFFNPEDPETPLVIDMWLRKPSSVEYEQALGKARGKQGRRRQLYRQKDSDEFLALDEQIRELETKEDLVKEIMSFEENDLRTQAYNEALYGDNDDDEPRWGKDGADYLDVLAGLRARYEEIEKHNEGLAEEDKTTLEIKPEEDEEIVRLNEYIDQFGELRDERLEKLRARRQAKLENETMETLRKDLLKRMIDLEVHLVHYQEFKTMMVYFTCRYSDDHHKRYFGSPDEIWDLPDYVRVQLFDAYDQLEQGADNLKNLPSPQPS